MYPVPKEIQIENTEPGEAQVGNNSSRGKIVLRFFISRAKIEHLLISVLPSTWSHLHSYTKHLKDLPEYS